MEQPVELKTIRLKGHERYNEAWLQEVIATNPKILGLGTLAIKDRERSHKGFGRLDMLLQEENDDQFEKPCRYEIELQLGTVDESHIIRTIEYWDRERKRYPQYEHVAVIVAENITSRFLNVIGLLNGTIPLIALQLTAIETKEGVGLIFTKIVDILEYGLEEDDEIVSGPKDRSYWEKKASPETVKLADSILLLAKSFEPNLELSYQKNYIGFRLSNKSVNFSLCKPRTQAMALHVIIPQDDAIDRELEKVGIDLLSYGDNRYRINLKGNDIEKNKEYLTHLLKLSYEKRA